MKKKLFICALAAAAVGSNAFALQITKGKLISHKEWTTGNAIASSLPGTKTLDSIIRNNGMKKSDLEFSHFYLTAETAPATGHAGEPIAISNDAYIYAYNRTHETQTYNYTFDICTQKSDHIVECVYSTDLIELQPGGMLVNATQPVLTVKFDEPGTYQAEARSYLYTGNVKTSLSTSIADITVT